MASKVHHIIRWSVQDWRTSRIRTRSIRTGDQALRLVYLEILNALYELGGQVPADPEDLVDLIGIPIGDIERVLPILLDLGRKGRGGLREVQCEDGCYLVNERASQDIEEELSFREKQRGFGKLGGRPNQKESAPELKGEPKGTKGEPKGSLRVEKDTPSPPAPLPLPLPLPTPIKEKTLPSGVAPEGPPPDSDAPEGKPGGKSRNSKKPAPKFPDIDTLVRFLERYPDLDMEPVREALRGWLLVAQDEGNAVSAAFMTEQLKKCAAWGPERSVAAMNNSANKRLKFIGEPFPDRGNGKNPTGLPMHEPGLTADQKRRRIGAPADWREQLQKRMEDVIPWDPRTGKFIEDPKP